MPMAMCPICGAVMHLNVSDVVSWYRERHPDAQVGDLVPELCPFCFGEIGVGDKIVTRQLKNDNMEIGPKQNGRVKRVLTNCDYGRLFVIVLDDGKQITLPRSAIRIAHVKNSA